MKPGSAWKWVQTYVCGALLLIPVAVLSHEYGHARTALRLGAPHAEVYVWPGYQVYPRPGLRYGGQWPEGSLAITDLPGTFAQPQMRLPDTPESLSLRMPDTHIFLAPSRMDSTQLFLVQLMGSGFNQLLSLLALAALALVRPTGLFRSCLVCGSLLHLDMLAYAVLPEFFGARHLLFWGGSTPEPLIALQGLGIGRGKALVGIVLLSGFQIAVLARLAAGWKPRNTPAVLHV